MKKVLKLLIVLFATLQIQAQQKEITGTISDGSHLPLPGVNVLVKGTSNGTTTDFNGNYAIMAKVGDVIVYSYVGNTVEKTVGALNNISFPIAMNTLEEVVVTSLGIKRKKDNITHVYQSVKVNGNRSSNSYRGYYNASKETKRTNVSIKKLLRQNNPSVVNSLSGKVSGLTITQNNNGVNGGTRIVLRGNRSIKGGNQALVVIDGKITTTKELNKLKAKNIKAVNVIKGAAGSALYGSQGNNGVIVVVTKRGNYKLSKEVKAAIQKQSFIRRNSPQPLQDTYVEIIENNFEITNTSPLSTFSIDVDKASYSNVRRMINNGQTIAPDAIKIEEMVNYFDYNYLQPTSKHPFSINTEFANANC